MANSPASKSSALTQAAAKAPLIDMHHHPVPPFYLAEYRDRIAGSRGGEITRAWLDWTPEQSLAAMDDYNVTTAILSLTTPGLWFGNVERARKTARQFNEYAVDLARQHPGRFGVFAAIPLPDTEGSLREIAYAFDVLGVDGVGLLSCYDDKFLGEPAFAPVFEELDRRKAIVFIHPTAPSCCQGLMPGIATPMLEVPHDTARTVVSLLFSGTLSRLRNIRFILCHAGGTLPVVARRISLYASRAMNDKVPNGVEHELRRLYYDIAISGYRPAIAALTSLVPMSQILFGSDHPFRALAESAGTMHELGLSEADLRAIGRDNALTLLPRLRSIS
ncbi:MAG TPA: amidohydrolase family protein [Stellaceae bacterium]|nr:amidohydrolase family protein [Stellaceae bacterium]